MRPVRFFHIQKITKCDNVCNDFEIKLWINKTIVSNVKLGHWGWMWKFKIWSFKCIHLNLPLDQWHNNTHSRSFWHPSVLAGCPRWSHRPVPETDSLRSWSCQTLARGQAPATQPHYFGESVVKQKTHSSGRWLMSRGQERKSLEIAKYKLFQILSH